MARGVVWFLVAPLVAMGLVGCRFFNFEEREPWRMEAEERCLAERLVQPSASVEPASAIDGPGICGMVRPFKVAAMSYSQVALEPQATLACPIIANLDGWFAEAVQPAATAWFGEPVAEIRQLSSYACRSMNGQRGASISEHAFGNALDIATFRLESGREVTVKDGWKGSPEERGFLRQVQAAACERFSTVLAPGADAFHYDHIHVDLARRVTGRTVCKPEPELIQPPRWQDVPVAGRTPPSPSPWQAGPVARQAPPPSQSLWRAGSIARGNHMPSGPTVIAAEPIGRPAGPPMALGTQPPSPRAIGTQPSIEQRTLESVGGSGMTGSEPYVRAAPSIPDRPVPPANIPTARRGDPVVTGSAGERKDAAAGKGLFDPDSILNQKGFSSEAASVFDLPPVKARKE